MTQQPQRRAVSLRPDGIWQINEVWAHPAPAILESAGGAWILHKSNERAVYYVWRGTEAATGVAEEA